MCVRFFFIFLLRFDLFTHILPLHSPDHFQWIVTISMIIPHSHTVSVWSGFFESTKNLSWGLWVSDKIYFFSCVYFMYYLSNDSIHLNCIYFFYSIFSLALICIYISSSYYLFFSSFWSDYFVYKRFVLSELASWVFARWRYVLNCLTGNDLFSTVRNELNADHKIDGNKTRCGHLTWPNEILWLQTNGVFSFQFVYQFTMQPIFCGWTLNSWSKHLRIESKDSYGIMMRRVKKRIEMPIRSAIHTIRTQHAAETIKYCSD